MKQISEKARGTAVGYFLSENNIVLTPMPTTAIELMASYTRRIPSLGISHGTIASIIANTSITLSAGFTLMTDVDDFFSVIDTAGVVIRNNLTVSQVAGVLSLNDTSSILAGMKVVPGSHATTISQLPDELEASLIMGLETFINARLSSKDLSFIMPLSQAMLTQIGEMFADNNTDTFTPPIVEYTEWV